MGRSHRLGAAVVLASIVAATGAAPASADVPVTVTPVHGRTLTTFAIKFTPPVRNERYRNLILLTGPVGSRCRRPYGDTLYTPGETPPPANRRLTWRFGTHARPDVAANGDFSFRVR
jgi:hypothetical protein